MKQRLLIVLILFLLTVPAYAENNTPATPLYLQPAMDACGIDLKYAVKNEDVVSVEVQFAELNCYHYANYDVENGYLKIAIASALPLNMPQVMGYATAVLENGVKIAPELELISVRFDGNVINPTPLLEALSAKKTDAGIVVSCSIHTALLGESVTLLVAAYGVNGRMLQVKMETLQLSTSDTNRVLIADSGGITTVKVFLLQNQMCPMVDCNCLGIE